MAQIKVSETQKKNCIENLVDDFIYDLEGAVSLSKVDEYASVVSSLTGKECFCTIVKYEIRQTVFEYILELYHEGYLDDYNILNGSYESAMFCDDNSVIMFGSQGSLNIISIEELRNLLSKRISTYIDGAVEFINNDEEFKKLDSDDEKIQDWITDICYDYLKSVDENLVSIMYFTLSIKNNECSVV